ncbi:MAG: phosphatidylserine decarboxylase [Verrucomicrobiales bacterium]|nr:phosphatidylserine decarboxylase [Verrucomicrobiales bacterium]
MEQRQELVYFDRYEQALKTEGIYGEKPLRWAYETRLGKIALEGVIKHRWFSGLYGKWADCACSRKEIATFVDRFGLDRKEFLAPLESLETFNKFFHRELKPSARPLAPGGNAVSFPADGRHLFIPDLSQSQPIWAKGQQFDLAALLHDETLAARFAKGSALISRLCPTDYHRFHFPLDGTPGSPRLINGPLYSVNPIALSKSLSYLWENKRRVTVVRDSPVDEYLFLEIGATNVGSIVDTSEAEIAIQRGDEKGYFRFGGSMVMMIFPEGSIDPAPDLATQSRVGIELYVRVKDEAGSVRK